MDNGWQEETPISISEVLDILLKLYSGPQKWICRGTRKEFQKKLIPSIDREPYNDLKRKIKIELERESIEQFRSTYALLSTATEKILFEKDITTLMLMQHYGSPTRLLDWSLSPYVAAYFAACEKLEDEEKKEDGLIWIFDYDRYIEMGDNQWKKKENCEMLVKGNVESLKPAFRKCYSGEWIICQFLNKFSLPGYFSRIFAQNGCFSFCSQFDSDQAKMISKLLNGPKYQRIIRIKYKFKFELRQILKCHFNIWHGSLFPDMVGAAEAANEMLFDRAKKIKKKKSK